MADKINAIPVSDEELDNVSGGALHKTEDVGAAKLKRICASPGCFTPIFLKDENDQTKYCFSCMMKKSKKFGKQM